MTATADFGYAQCDVLDGYRPMTDGEKAAYYPGAAVGQAYLDEQRRAAVRFEAYDASLIAENIETRLLEYYANYARMAPGFQLGETLQKGIPGGAVGVMSFKSNAPTRDLFNMLAVISAGGKEHIALFSCDMKDASEVALDWSRAFAGIRAIAGQDAEA